MNIYNQLKNNRYNRIDITSYSDNELSLVTYNTYELYEIRYSQVFIQILKAFYRFTEKQLDVLLNDLVFEIGEELKEYIKGAK